MHRNCIDPVQSGQAPSVFDTLKWRRRGTDRRSVDLDESRVGDGYAENRSLGDRRRHLMDVISKIIFPRIKDDL